MSKPPHKSGGSGRGRSTGGSRPGGFNSGARKSGNSRSGGYKTGSRDSASGEDRRDVSSRDASDREFGRGAARGTGRARPAAKQETKSSFGDRRRERSANDRARRERGTDSPTRYERPRSEGNRSDRPASDRYGNDRQRPERDRSDRDRYARGRDERAFSAERGGARTERRSEGRPEGRADRRDERGFTDRPSRDRPATERGRPAFQGEKRSFGKPNFGERNSGEHRSGERGPRAGGARYETGRSGGDRSGGARYNGERGGQRRDERGNSERGQFDRSRLDRANRPAQNARKAAHPAPRAAAPTPKDPTLPEREGERIAKLLARAGIASRREAERLVEAGRVKLGEEVIETPSTVLTSLQGVTVDGVPVREAESTRLFVFHKPAGLLTAERDPAGRPTIYTALRNALPEGAGRVMPVGRLDLNTEGLLLLTNDGEFKRQLELPSTGVPRTYRARTFGDITQAQLEELMHGIEIEGVIYGSINANMERRTGRNQWIELTLTEGKNREVRRVLEALGLQVSRLLRTAYGPFVLGDMPKGTAGEISQKDLDTFRRSLVKGGNAGGIQP